MGIDDQSSILQNFPSGGWSITVLLVMVILFLAIVAWAFRFQQKFRRLRKDLAEASAREEALKAKLAEAEAQLRQTKESIRKASDDLNAFMYSVSHDLKAPQRAITGFSEILAEEYGTVLDKNAMRMVGVIRENSARMERLINDLLELARIGVEVDAKETVDMRELVDAVLRTRILPAGAEVNMFQAGMAHGNRELLRKVWEVLLDNAIKFSSRADRPRLDVGSKTDNDEMLYWVSDNGVGFDPAYKEKLFRVFSRLHSKKDFEGTGSGLAIAKKIIDAHAGRIWAEAVPGKGATFYFTLPQPQTGNRN